jgi:gentisate 1,2-dioxygenase
VISFEPFRKGRLPINEGVDPATFYGFTRPISDSGSEAPRLLHYHWRDTYPSLERLARTPGDPFDGAALEFVNPATGGPTLPTMSCRVQMLRPAEQTRSHRHTGTSIYHAFRGSGTTTIDGQPFHWRKGDTFIVPLWSWHEHANLSSTEAAILFSMHDEPILKAFGLYREEARDRE